jgi:hypothetical protein
MFLEKMVSESVEQEPLECIGFMSVDTARKSAIPTV